MYCKYDSPSVMPTNAFQLKAHPVDQSPSLFRYVLQSRFTMVVIALFRELEI